MSSQENTIHIQNGNYIDIKTAVQHWIEQYLERLDANLKFTLFIYDKTHIVIELSQEIENNLFNFLVNYLTYSENINNKLSVNGYTIIKDRKVFPKELLNLPVQIYVPKDDTEYDVVFGVVESGDTYKIDFGGKTVQTATERNYTEPKIDSKKTSSETVDVSNIIDNQKSVEVNRFDVRFPKIAAFYIIGTLIAVLFTYKTDDSITVIKISSFALFIWVMFENELLRFNNVYLKLMSLSILLSVFGYYLSVIYVNDFWFNSTKLSLFFLILHKILRYLYIRIYNREPIFDSQSKLIGDKIFSIVLLLGTIFISIFLFKF